jgi:heme-degrading monooxygenase HmoA
VLAIVRIEAGADRCVVACTADCLTEAMFIIVWKYVVSPEHSGEFVQAYGPGGPWERLFLSAPGYSGTELIVGDDEDCFLTIDRWQTKSAFEGFMRSSRPAYEQLDEKLDALTTSEVLIGRGMADVGDDSS